MACEKCNVVVNELLSFINHKIDTLDEVSIIQICDSAYTEQDVDAAKTLLCACLPSCRRTTRKGDQRKKRTIQDIITVLKETDPDDVPKFVACDLNKLPPVTFDHVDVTAFLKDLTIIKKDIALLKGNGGTSSTTDSSIVAEVQLLKLAVEQLSQATSTRPHTPPPPPRCAVSTQTEGETQCWRNVVTPHTCDRIGSANFAELQSCRRAVVVESSKPRAVSSTPTSRHVPPLPLNPAETAVAAPTSLKRQGRRHRRCRRRETGQRNIENFRHSENEARRQIPNQEEAGFVLVESRKKRRARRNKCGTASPEECSLKAAPRTSFVYVSRLRRGTEASDVSRYIEERGEKAVSVDPLPSHWADTGFCAFRLTVLAERIQTFLRAEFWPIGVMFRRFIRAPQREVLRQQAEPANTTTATDPVNVRTASVDSASRSQLASSSPVLPPQPPPQQSSSAALQAVASSAPRPVSSPQTVYYEYHRPGHYWDERKRKWRFRF